MNNSFSRHFPFKRSFLVFIIGLCTGLILNSQTISIQGINFYVNGTSRIWLNGANTPWHSWNDFGGSFDRNWWNSHFQTLKSKGINCSRIWISCDGNGAVKTNSAGVTGVSSTFFKDCDTLFAIAGRNGIYIDATMMSFDHCKSPNANCLNWRNVITSQTASQTFIDNYLLPFVNRYKSNPYLFAIDLCNEPEWISENTEDGKLAVSSLQRFFAMCAVAIHNNSSLPVTIGSACIKWNSSSTNCVGNYWKNAALKAAYNNPKSFIDFYCVHYYAWMHSYFASPFEKSPADYGINDRPVIIEESPGKDDGLTDIPITLASAYEAALAKGYQGNLPWTSNGVDNNGSITTVGPATLAFKNKHPELVYPLQINAGINNNFEQPFEIYPNPSKGVFFLSYNNSRLQHVNLEIYNMQGRLTQPLFLSSNEIDLSNSPDGIYLVRMDAGIMASTRKILLKK